MARMTTAVVVGVLALATLHASSASAQDAPRRGVTQSERAFFNAAMAYVDSANDAAHVLSRAITDAITPTETIRALDRARQLENAVYNSVYARRTKGAVPAGWDDVAKTVETSHRLFQSGTSELEAAWKGQDLPHVNTGLWTLERAAAARMTTGTEAHARWRALVAS